LAIEFNDANFQSEVLSSEALVVVDFGATWCQPCKMLAPIIDELAAEYGAVEYEGKVKIGKADIDEAQETAAKFGIMSVPTVMYFKGGEVVDTDVGVNAKAVYKQKIDALI
jgi:thioredoxin 1